MRKTRLSKVLALALVFVMVMSSVTSAAASTVISNTLTATVTVTENSALAALKAVNNLNIIAVETDAEFKMLAALENPALGLNLTEYNKLTSGGRRQAVADYVSFTKFANGNFITVADVQAALNLGVQIETNKMKLIQLATVSTSETLKTAVDGLKLDNVGFLGKFSEVKIKGFFGEGFVSIVNEQNTIFDAYIALNEAGKIEASTLFNKNIYSGSYVTVLNNLKNAIQAATAEPAITLQWLTGGTVTDNNLAINNVEVGNSATLSFKATTDKAVTDIGYIVTSDKYITVNGITALKHYIDSNSLLSGASETINVNIKFEAVGSCNLNVVAVKQEDISPATLSGEVASITINNQEPRIAIAFTLSEEIDLSQDKLGNVIISYGKIVDNKFVETLRADGTPIVKSKTWSGYLNLGDTTTKYCSGAVNNLAYTNIVPANSAIKTVVDSNYTTMGYANDSAWTQDILAGNVVVKITVIDNEGNISEDTITATAQ